jgi:hypothetical protein
MCTFATHTYEDLDSCAHRTTRLEVSSYEVASTRIPSTLREAEFAVVDPLSSGKGRLPVPAADTHVAIR